MEIFNFFFHSGICIVRFFYAIAVVLIYHTTNKEHKEIWYNSLKKNRICGEIMNNSKTIWKFCQKGDSRNVCCHIISKLIIFWTKNMNQWKQKMSSIVEEQFYLVSHSHQSSRESNRVSCLLHIFDFVKWIHQKKMEFQEDHINEKSTRIQKYKEFLFLHAII